MVCIDLARSSVFLTYIERAGTTAVLPGTSLLVYYGSRILLWAGRSMKSTDLLPATLRLSDLRTITDAWKFCVHEFWIVI